MNILKLDRNNIYAPESQNIRLNGGRTYTGETWLEGSPAIVCKEGRYRPTEAGKTHTLIDGFGRLAFFGTLNLIPCVEVSETEALDYRRQIAHAYKYSDILRAMAREKEANKGLSARALALSWRPHLETLWRSTAETRALGEKEWAQKYNGNIEDIGRALRLGERALALATAADYGVDSAKETFPAVTIERGEKYSAAGVERALKGEADPFRDRKAGSVSGARAGRPKLDEASKATLACIRDALPMLDPQTLEAVWAVITTARADAERKAREAEEALAKLDPATRAALLSMASRRG